MKRTICLLTVLSVTNAAVLTNSSVEAPTLEFQENGDSIKMDTLTRALQQIDNAVQNLEEKAHNWDIFRHHIDSWNDQFKTLEHKLELVKRAQDEQQAFGNKLISLEFTLNHILSKILYLSDNCNMAQSPSITTSNDVLSNKSKLQQDTQTLLNEQKDLLKDVRTALLADKKQHAEIGTRLGNILRHVQNIERDSWRRIPSHTAATATVDNNKMAKIMAPIGNECIDSKRSSSQVERLLRTLEQQLTALTTRMPTTKEHKQLHTVTKKNTQQLEQILRMVTNTDERLLHWRDDEVRGWRHCAALDGELTTFTESSDLLLKRIELVVREVNEKLTCQRRGTEEALDVNTKEEEMDADEDSEDEGVPETDVHETVAGNDNERENEDEKRNTEKRGRDDETETNEFESDIDKSYEVVESFQPGIFGCHLLNVSQRVDMVYKFGKPILNQANRDLNERFCAFASSGPAWTVVQNRGPYAQQENFNRSWNEYRDGFGELSKDFWFGNEFIYQLVDSDDYELRVELTDFDDEQVWANYGIFRLDSERYNYNLLIGDYSGVTPDAMNYHNEMDFSTYDRRNDRSVDACCACATGYGSGWWFDNCSEANLNGAYRSTPTDHNNIGIIWEPWRGDYSLKKARMLIRPKHLDPLNMKATKEFRTEDP